MDFDGPIISLVSGPQIGLLCFILLFGAAVGGLALATDVPSRPSLRLTARLIRSGTTFVAVLAALMLTLLTFSLKTSFDQSTQDVRRFSIHLIQLDHTLRRAGLPGEAVRETLFRYTTRTIKDFWPKSHPNLRPEDTTSTALLLHLEDQIDTLSTPDSLVRIDSHRILHEAQSIRADLESRNGGTLSPWLLGFMLLWLMMTFCGLGMSAPRSPIAITALFLFAVAISGAVFLASEYDYPFDGVIIISTDPMDTALFAMTE